jgi:hypothetical protein
MSLHATFYTLLQGLVAGRVYPNVAPEGSLKPRLVLTRVGGDVAADLQGQAANLRNARMQIDAQADTRLEAEALIEQATNAALAGLQAVPVGAPVDDYDATTRTYRSLQDLSCWFDPTA